MREGGLPIDSRIRFSGPSLSLLDLHCHPTHSLRGEKAYANVFRL